MVCWRDLDSAPGHQGCFTIMIKEFNRESNISRISEHRERIEKVLLIGRLVRRQIEELCTTQTDIMYDTDEYQTTIMVGTTHIHMHTHT